MDGGSAQTLKTAAGRLEAARTAIFDIEGPLKEARRLAVALELAALGAAHADLSEEDTAEALVLLAVEARTKLTRVVASWEIAFDGICGPAGVQ